MPPNNTRALSDEPGARRPLKSRNALIFQRLAAWMARSGVTPNAISFTSMVFAAGAGAALVATPWTDEWAQRCCWLAAAALIQLRLVANLLDGMVAVEGGKGGPTGDLWNEAPDRVSDTLILVGAGYAAGSNPSLGFLAALGAMFVAYVRALGASVGAGQLFLGPMAKPHRMFLLTLLCLCSALLPSDVTGQQIALSHSATDLYLHDTYYVITGVSWHFSPATVALALVVIGCVVTAVRRLSRISDFLRARAKS